LAGAGFFLGSTISISESDPESSSDSLPPEDESEPDVG
jgi:hypothetical protein